MESIRLTIEIPAGLATALTGFLNELKVVALEKTETKNTVVGGVVGVVDVIDPPADAEEVIAYCQEHQLVANGRRFYNYYKDRTWHDTNGKPITNWKERLLMWDEEDRKKNPDRKPAVMQMPSPDDTDRLLQKMSQKENV